MLDQHRRAEQVIHRHVEIALNLRRVQIQSQRAARAGGFQQVRHELRGDRNPRLIFSILPRIAVIGEHRSDPPCRGALEGIDHQQQLEKVAVHRVMARLYDEYICAAHVFQDLEIDFAVAKAAQQRFAKGNVQVLADALCEHGVRRS